LRRGKQHAPDNSDFDFDRELRKLGAD
jgi:hypothetical protein